MSRTNLTPDLFFDLIDRRLTAIDICSRHELTFDQLEAVVQSSAFHDAAARLKAVEQTRCTATDVLRRTAALRTLEDIAAQQPSCPTHTETIRLAAAQILRVTHADPITADPTTPQQPPHQPDPHPNHQPAHHPPQDPPHPYATPGTNQTALPGQHAARKPDPVPATDWPTETDIQANPKAGPQPDIQFSPQPSPQPITRPNPTKATPPASAHDLVNRAGATQPFTSHSTSTANTPGTAAPPSKKRAPPPQHAA